MRLSSLDPVAIARGSGKIVAGNVLVMQTIAAEAGVPEGFA